MRYKIIATVTPIDACHVYKALLESFVYTEDSFDIEALQVCYTCEDKLSLLRSMSDARAHLLRLPGTDKALLERFHQHLTKDVAMKIVLRSVYLEPLQVLSVLRQAKDFDTALFYQSLEQLGELEINVLKTTVQALSKHKLILSPEDLDFCKDVQDKRSSISASIKAVLEADHHARVAKGVDQADEQLRMAQDELAQDVGKRVEALQKLAAEIKEKKSVTDNRKRTINYQVFDLNLSSRLLFKKELNELSLNEIKQLTLYLTEIRDKSICDNSQDSAPVASGKGYTTFIVKAGAQNDMRALLIQTDECLVIASHLQGHKALGGDGHAGYRDTFKDQVSDLLPLIQAKNTSESSGSDTSELEVNEAVAAAAAAAPAPASKKGAPTKKSKPKKGPLPSTAAAGPALGREVSLNQPKIQVFPTHADLMVEAMASKPKGELLDPLKFSEIGMNANLSTFSYGLFLGASLFGPIQGKPKDKADKKERDICKEELTRAERQVAPLKQLWSKLETLEEMSILKKEESGYFSKGELSLELDATDEGIDSVRKIVEAVNAVRVQLTKARDLSIEWDKCPKFAAYLAGLERHLSLTLHLLETQLADLKSKYIVETGHRDFSAYKDLGISMDTVISSVSNTDTVALVACYNECHRDTAGLKRLREKMGDVVLEKLSAEQLTYFLILSKNLGLEISDDDLSVIAEKMNQYDPVLFTEDPLRSLLIEDATLFKRLLKNEGLTNPDNISELLLLLLEMRRLRPQKIVPELLFKLEQAHVVPSKKILVVLMNHFSMKTQFQDAREYCKKYHDLVLDQAKQITSDDGKELLKIFQLAERNRRRNYRSKMVVALIVNAIVTTTVIEPQASEIPIDSNDIDVAWLLFVPIMASYWYATKTP